MLTTAHTVIPNWRINKTREKIVVSGRSFCLLVGVSLPALQEMLSQAFQLYFPLTSRAQGRLEASRVSNLWTRRLPEPGNLPHSPQTMSGNAHGNGDLDAVPPTQTEGAQTEIEKECWEGNGAVWWPPSSSYGDAKENEDVVQTETVDWVGCRRVNTKKQKLIAVWNRIF